MFDFPNAPSNGQLVQGSAGQIYAWDGVKWKAQMPPGPLSVNQGGTNATNAAQALANLGGISAPVSLTTQVTGILPVANGGTGVGTVAAAPWVELTGDRMTGPLTVSATSGWPQIIIDKTNANDANNLEGRRGGVSRWILKLGDHAVETGSGNVGSDLVAERYNDVGVFQGVPFSINRSTGLTTFTADAPTISLVPGASNFTSIMFRRNNGAADQHRWELFSSEAGDLQIRSINDGYSAAAAALIFRRAASGVGIAAIETDAGDFITRHLQVKPNVGNPVSAAIVMTPIGAGGNEIYGFGNNGQGRWLVQLGDGSAETGGNVGSFFRIHRYGDDGSYLGNPFAISRADGLVMMSKAQISGNDPLEMTSGGGGYPRIKYHLPGVRIWTLGPIPNATADFYLQDESAAGSRLVIVGGSGVCWSTNGTWNSLSDIATKKDIEPYDERGLAELTQLRPVKFKYNGELGSADDGIQRYGLIAQEVEPLFPEVINTLKHDDTDVLGVDSGRLIYAVINALKEVQTRLQRLEGTA